MDINPEDETSYTTQYQEAFLKYVEKEYCAKHRHVLVNILETVPSSNLVPSATASGSYQSSFDPFELSSDDEEYLTPNNVAETTPGRSDRAAHLLTAARLHLNSPPEAPKNWGQINPNLNDYHSDPMEISSTFWIPDITDWWRQQEETHSKYADLANVARDIFSIIPHGIGVEASFSLGWDVIGWRQSKTTGENLREEVVVRQFARANKGTLAGTDPELDAKNIENDSEMKTQAEERKLQRMAKVHDFLEMWQGSQNLRATQKESRARNKQMIAVGYISDTEAIVKASWPLFNMMVPLHLNRQKDHLCRHLCLQRTSLEEELKSQMSAKSGESTVIQSKATMIVHLKAFRIPMIGFTGMGTWIIQMTVRRIVQRMMNLI